MYYLHYEEPVFRPPSEANSLILQITIGCSQNHCTFCGMYKMKQFRVRDADEIVTEIEQLPAQIKQSCQRIFLADGDALIYPQSSLLRVLDVLNEVFPQLTRIGIYASPASLVNKTEEELLALRKKKLRILYFGLESGDDITLEVVNKGYSALQMLEGCQKAQAVGMKLSVTAILGLAGRGRSDEHALATARWINELSPEYFSLLTLFRRHNDAYFERIDPLTQGQIIEEALLLTNHLNPHRTILRSNHVSNLMHLAGSYPKDRERIVAQVTSALTEARRHPQWFNSVPDYGESIY